MGGVSRPTPDSWADWGSFMEWFADSSSFKFGQVLGIVGGVGFEMTKHQIRNWSDFRRATVEAVLAIVEENE